MTRLSLLAGLAGALLLSGAAQAGDTFSIIQDRPKITHIDLGEKGPSHGDMMAYEASFTTADGTKGTMDGLVTTVDVPDGAGDTFFDRLADIVLDFGKGDTLVIAGHTVFTVGDGEIVADAPQVRAIVGGTGRFIGKRGQITTTRREAGHYEHKIELVD
ncbi:hypothetical protein [Ancylobacter lacus]|uniref:hypothetical protein n=1 Tax=Ancylobacter lacus TaxID=2579970 RepID=UPI001BD0B99E|nr:hypothetical protein [Ancylobacter lacus]MBS7538433.1 hypothetical protein [Ancylobacter lacus]